MQFNRYSLIQNISGKILFTKNIAVQEKQFLFGHILETHMLAASASYQCRMLTST
jgi:hypothetical protein